MLLFFHWLLYCLRKKHSKGAILNKYKTVLRPHDFLDKGKHIAIAILKVRFTLDIGLIFAQMPPISSYLKTILRSHYSFLGWDRATFWYYLFHYTATTTSVAALITCYMFSTGSVLLMEVVLLLLYKGGWEPKGRRGVKLPRREGRTFWVNTHFRLLTSSQWLPDAPWDE